MEEVGVEKREREEGLDGNFVVNSLSLRTSRSSPWALRSKRDRQRRDRIRCKPLLMLRK